jgi:hypothetical protein
MNFDHVALGLQKPKSAIYTAMSKHHFYFRMFISKFVFEQGGVPINPFMLADYFLLDTVDRDVIRASNNTLITKSDELWVFGPVADGVLAEIKIAKMQGKPIRYFNIVKSKDIVEISKEQVILETEVENFRSEL